MCMYAHVHLVRTNDIQQSNCGVSYPHAVSVKGVPNYREAGGAFPIPTFGSKRNENWQKTSSQRCLTLQCAMESKPKPKKGNIHHQV